MAKASPTPPAPPPEQAVTPLQKLLAGTFLIGVIVCPLLAFGLYLAPLYKSPGALYRGDYFMIGLGAGAALSFALSFLWMAYLPGLLERRERKREQREADAREQKRADEKKAREDAAEAKRDASEEE